MQAAAKINRFMEKLLPGFEVAQYEQGAHIGEFLLRRLRGAASLEAVATIGSRLAAEAYSQRDMQTVDQAASLLEQLPNPTAQISGQYYKAICMIRNQNEWGPMEAVCEILRGSRHPLKGKGLISMGTRKTIVSEFYDASSIYGQALSVCDGDIETRVMALKMRATIISLHGDHTRSLSLLEEMYPLARAAGNITPAVFYDYLNSLAEEFRANEKLDRALRISRKLVSSALIDSYPEWRETHEDIVRQLPSRHVACDYVLPPENLLFLEENRDIHLKTGRLVVFLLYPGGADRLVDEPVDWNFVERLRELLAQIAASNSKVRAKVVIFRSRGREVLHDGRITEEGIDSLLDLIDAWRGLSN